MGNVELPPPQAGPPSPAVEFIAGFVGGFFVGVILLPVLVVLPLIVYGMIFQ